MMRKLSPRGERQLTCPHMSASSHRRICTAVANLSLSSSTLLIIHHPSVSQIKFDAPVNRSRAAIVGFRTGLIVTTQKVRAQELFRSALESSDFADGLSSINHSHPIDSIGSNY